MSNKYIELPLSNLILRIDDAEISPHAELEDVSTAESKIYIKEYNIFLLNSEKDVLDAIADATRIASEITTGQKAIHISKQSETFVLRIDATLLNAIANSGCRLEIY